MLRYNQAGSTTFQTLGGSADVDLIGGVSTSGPLIKENCALHSENGTSWDYPDQTSAYIQPSSIPRDRSKI
jgi:hypothetical protein